ncbi:uncharacterized protein LACBIDRAFT_300440 [Laccaria bicolor S238N-H82]|uniref:Predicted protein n=1 Tax=Laccaria bicolor (strain S238N-H82 / ATCC MYA-4686) TaxID=486041 RepID=B0DGS6_LACBS|nr:uncharacterized protein LACBIDRAFT_300440 [Laccaria bicolor S238N-H82]EDR06323.1 predicted protein [Laccaria bicolor S238N-H82]|eukprot:XP_001883184.1 predicted protein [Laccaria bicolor S238N-H82]
MSHQNFIDLVNAVNRGNDRLSGALESQIGDSTTFECKNIIMERREFRRYGLGWCCCAESRQLGQNNHFPLRGPSISATPLTWQDSQLPKDPPVRHKPASSSGDGDGATQRR